MLSEFVSANTRIVQGTAIAVKKCNMKQYEFMGEGGALQRGPRW